LTWQQLKTENNKLSIYVMEFTSGGISEMYKNKCFLKCNFLMEWKGLKVYIQSAKLGGSLMPEACKIIHERIK
jgi:hypothetical protein